MDKYIVALDLGSSKISTILARRENDDETFEIIRREFSDSSGIKQGIIENPSSVTGIINLQKKCLQNQDCMLKKEIVKCYVNLAGFSLDSQLIQISRQFDEETEITESLTEELCEEALQSVQDDLRIGFIALEQEYKIDDSWVIEAVGKKVQNSLNANILVVSGLRKSKEEIIKCMELAKLQYELHLPINMAYSLISPEEAEKGCAIVDFGADTSTLVVVENGFIRHCSTIPYGGRTVTEDLKKSLKISFFDAEKAKKYYSSAYSVLCDDKIVTIPSHQNGADAVKFSTLEISKIVEARFVEIINAICGKIDDCGYWDKISRFVITGGASQQKGLKNLIEYITDKKVRFASYNSIKIKKDSNLELIPENAVLFGLLNFAYGDCSIDKNIDPVPTPKGKKTTKEKSFIGNIKDKFGRFTDSFFDEVDEENNN